MDRHPTLEALARRLQALEDERAVLDCINRYCFAIDLRMDEDYYGNLSDDCVIDLGDTDGAFWTGQDGARSFVADMVGPIREPRLSGSLHLSGPLRVNVTGEEATAEGYSAVVADKDGRSVIATSGFNHWDLRREDGRWKVKRRLRRALGEIDARRVMFEFSGADRTERCGR